MKELRGPEPRVSTSWVGWCCSYCSGPLEERAHGLYCAAEQRWFATDRGIHRLLPDERRQEILPHLELYQRARRDAGWTAVPGLPEVPAGHPRAAIWREKAARFRRALSLVPALLGRGSWRILDVGAGCCWASARLLDEGHRVAAVDVSLDPEDGLPAADRLLDDARRLPRAEAEMEALPLEPGLFDLVLAAASLHYAQRLTRALVELRRVTRRGGLLLVLDSPVFRWRQDGEARVADRMKRLGRRYGFSVPRESLAGYLVLDELQETFRSAGWGLEIHGWPGRLREWARDALEIARGRRRPARFPILVARRDG